MAKFVNKGDTIEAEHADACSRKFDWKGLRKHPETDENMMLYECTRNSTIEVIKECGESNCSSAQYHITIGDVLEADAISIYTASRRKQDYYVKEGASGRHGAQFMDFRRKTIGTIKYPLANLRQCIESQKQTLVNKTQSIIS